MKSSIKNTCVIEDLKKQLFYYLEPKAEKRMIVKRKYNQSSDAMLIK